jgi:hypothetical protein
LCLLITFALFVPVAVVIFFVATAHHFKKSLDIPTIGVDDPKEEIEIIDESPKITSSKYSSPLFIVDQKFAALQLCVDSDLDGQASAIKSTDITENQPLLLYSDRISSIESPSTWQLCIAHHDHQHAFKLKTYPNSNGSKLDKNLKVDCDLFLSTSVVSPGPQNWDWKSNDRGHDSITIHSYAAEFQKSSLNTLFISVGQKNLYQGVSSGCVLELEVITVANEELLHKMGSLRGGQVLLPRDLHKLIANQH